MIDGERALRLMLKPIQHVLDDSGVTEIVINRPHEVGVEKEGKWHWLEVGEYDFDRLDAIAITAAYMSNLPCGPANPLCGSTLPDGQRIQICRPPATKPDIISLTIRKPSVFVHTVNDPDFVGQFRAVNSGQSQSSRHDAELLRLYHAKDWPEFFRLAVIARKTIAATGSTGSGKTFFLRRVMREIPEYERLVSIEDTSEFNLAHKNHVALFFGASGITAVDAVQASLRMRPDRVLMQELKSGPDAFAYMRVLHAGHPGGMTTWHSEQGEGAFEALSLMLKQSGQGLGDDEIRVMVRRYLDIVVWCSRDSDGFNIPFVWFKLAEDRMGRMAA
jgi:type IV secretion system protein VirB11